MTAAAESAALIRSQRWAALAVFGEDGPGGSMVAYAPEPGLRGVLLFLSGLAAHTRLLFADGRVALVVSEPDTGEGDPQTLPRVTLEGLALPLHREDQAFADAWALYSARFPAAVPRLALPDFTLFRVEITRARFVGGFARAATLAPADLEAAAG